MNNLGTTPSTFLIMMLQGYGKLHPAGSRQEDTGPEEVRRETFNQPPGGRGHEGVEPGSWEGIGGVQIQVIMSLA